MKRAFVVVVLVVLAFCVGRCSVEVHTHTQVALDTITRRNIEPTIISPVTRIDIPTFAIAKLPIVRHVRDTVLKVDSVEVIVPRSAYVFEEDSVYRAEVSGFAVTLDKMQVFSKTITQTRIVTQKSHSRWGLGVQVGYGATTSNGLKLQPYVGIGVSYNLITW